MQPQRVDFEADQQQLPVINDADQMKILSKQTTLSSLKGQKSIITTFMNSILPIVGGLVLMNKIICGKITHATLIVFKGALSKLLLASF